jgi:hypothetical protein
MPSATRLGPRRRLGAAAAALAALAAMGGLGACQTVYLGDPPADVNACRPGQQFFVDQIYPNVLAKDYGGKTCGDASCHAPGNQHQLLLVAPPAGSTPAVVGGAITPMQLADDYTSAANQMNCANVSASSLLAKPSGLQTHGGGMLFSPTGMEAQLIEMWVGQP